MHTDAFHVDEIGSWAWIAGATFAATVVASILFAPTANVKLATEVSLPPPLTVPTVLPPVTTQARA
jgi:hypothetical protein